MAREWRTEWIPSPNFSLRFARPFLVVLHETVGSFESALRTLRSVQRVNPLGRVSAHYLVARYEPRIVKLVPISLKAWHVGRNRSRFVHPETRVIYNDVASISVGIEVTGPNDGTPWTDVQYDAVAWLIRQLKLPYVTRHGDIDLHGKTDPRGCNMRQLFERLKGTRVQWVNRPGKVVLTAKAGD